MKRQHLLRGVALLLGASLLVALTACAAKSAKPDNRKEEGPPPETLHALGLTPEQRMEDYEYFWTTLRDSYPCWGILEREGVDTDIIYQEYKELVAEEDSDLNFYSAIYSALWRLGQNGHLWIEEPESYRESKAMMEAYEGDDRKTWARILVNPDTAAKYEKLDSFLRLVEGEETTVDTAEEVTANITTLLLPGERVGYLKINSFAGDMAQDKPVIDAFYQEVSGYGDMVIDLTSNSGGSEYYWQDLLVAPNIDQPLSCENFALTRMSGNNRPYLEEVFTPEELRPISELPELINLAPEDRALATHFVSSRLAVEPAAKRSPFHGRIWLLVNDRVYSASESFAVFSQQTGFATLVGTQTGGDGIGALDPIMMQLSNSGIIIQFTAMYGLNPDGRSNEEYGTTPDIISLADEAPLVTALRSIQQTKMKG